MTLSTIKHKACYLLYDFTMFFRFFNLLATNHYCISLYFWRWFSHITERIRGTFLFSSCSQMHLPYLLIQSIEQVDWKANQEPIFGTVSGNKFKVLFFFVLNDCTAATASVNMKKLCLLWTALSSRTSGYNFS